MLHRGASAVAPIRCTSAAQQGDPSMRMKMIAVSLLALVAASPAMAQYQPGPNIINGRPVVIGSNGLPLDYGPQTPCGYGQAVFSLIERTASRLDPNSLASP